MKTDLFLRKLEEALEIEDNTLSVDTNLEDYDEYDSLAVLSIIAMVDEEMGKKIPGSEFSNIRTVKSIIHLIGEEYFE